MSPKCCCQVFSSLVSAGTDHGFAEVPELHPDFGLVFFLQYRAVAADNDEVLFEPSNMPIVRKVRQAIKFCPWCGTNLASYYGNDPSHFPFLTMRD